MRRKKSKSPIKHRIGINRIGKNSYTLTRFDYWTEDGSLVMHAIYWNLSRKEAYDLKRLIMKGF